MRLRLLTLLAALAAASAPLGAQHPQYTADFPAVREAFQRGDVKRAAFTLQLASAHVREEVGRCRDGEVGARLMAAESRLDALAAALKGGGVASVEPLDAAFAATDRVLAEHHVRLASWGWSNLRQSSGLQIGHDLGAAATHHVRGVRSAGRVLDEAARQAVADAERVANAIALQPDALPKETGAVIAALGRVVLPPQLVAERVPGSGLPR